MKTIDCIVGARPNFMKMAPLLRALEADGRRLACLVHTGQHYDPSMSDVFFEQLGIRAPDVRLEVGSDSHARQTARIMERFEAHLNASNPAGVVVVGDVNSTLACTLTAAKLQIPVAHVEAGLRSFDRTMPEEINRVVTDALSDILLVTEESGGRNLLHEGIDPSKIHLIGNLMIDTLVHELPHARELGMPARLGLEDGNYGLLTLHRPSNVDDPATLGPLIHLLAELSRDVPLAFPVHPRTRGRIEAAGLIEPLRASRIVLTDPLGYRENLALMASARVVLTDSGGMQEETSALGVPCLTLRANTERPVTVEQGTSTLVGADPELIRSTFRDVLDGRYKRPGPIPFWDGRAGERAADVLRSAWSLIENPSTRPSLASYVPIKATPIPARDQIAVPIGALS